MIRYKLNEKYLENLNERYVNAFGDGISKYIDEIWDIMIESYKYLDGGFATASSPEALLRKTHMAKMVRRNGKIVCAVLYKDKHGRKSIAAGTDGSSEGKAGIRKIWEEDIKLGRSWAEVSGKTEHIKLKMGAIPIPNTMAAQLLNSEILSLDNDGYHYTRMIGGQEHRKLIIGEPQ